MQSCGYFCDQICDQLICSYFKVTSLGAMHSYYVHCWIVPHSEQSMYSEVHTILCHYKSRPQIKRKCQGVITWNCYSYIHVFISCLTISE